MSRSPIVVPGDVADRYLLENELGRGGTAIVYRARDRVRGTTVAIKLLREDALGSLSVERFVREIKLTSQLPHPHIVPVLDSGEYDGRPYFVLPLMEGGTLRHRLAREKQLRLGDVVALGVTICKALEFAHANGLIHRDVKPENILFSDDTPCLADFGTARALEKAATDPITSTGIVRGTPAYMSPEQASGEREYDGRTDIYSLGCVLYEAVAGMPPFVGPTAQAIISQRMTHAPRPVSVYRPNVPTELEDVLAKATSIVPADRYQTAREFATALEGVVPALGRPRTSTVATPIGPGRARRLALFAAGVAAVSVIAATLVKAGVVALPWMMPPAGDTTRLAILPFEVKGAQQEIAGEDLMYEGMRRWAGASVAEPFAMNDAIRQLSGGESLQEAVATLPVRKLAHLVAEMGAGRYVRGEVMQRMVRASLYDVQSRKALYSASFSLPEDPAQLPAMYAALADSLLLRGANDTAARVSAFATASLPGTQVFLRARGALAEWNLATAESLFATAIEFDSTRTAARLWLAQIRAWRDEPLSRWRDLASAAVADGHRLTTAELQQARALVALGSGEYAASCAIYRDIKDHNPASFTGWYGLGDCHRKDRIVIADSRSPSGWRFRSSREQAIQAYKKAFEVFPTAYRGVQANAYESMRVLLFTNPLYLARGHQTDSAPNSFAARLSLDADTVIFVPYPAPNGDVGQSRVSPVDAARAAARNRRLFADVAARWSASFPRSVGAKEATGVSLEMLGDLAAADSFLAARKLATDRATRLRLAVEEAVVRIRHAVAERPQDVSVARQLVDSILRDAVPATREDADLLLRIAMITGHCRQAAGFARMATQPLAGMSVPPSLLADVNAFVAMSVSGCEAPGFAALVDQLQAAANPSSSGGINLYASIGAVAGLRYPADEPVARRLGGMTSHYILGVERNLVDGDRAAAGEALHRSLPARRASLPGTLSPDVALVEARLWLELSDSVVAVSLLDKSLTGLRYAQPLMATSLVVNMLHVGTIGAAAELRANLAADPKSRRRWALTVADLWETADPELKARAVRMRALAAKSSQ